MMKNMCLLLCLLLLSACIALPDNKLARANLNVGTNSTTGTSICYSTKFKLEGNREYVDVVDNKILKESDNDLNAIVASLLSKQKMFTPAKGKPECEGYSLEFVMEQKKFPAGDYIMELFGGMTFGVIPLTETYVWDLNVSVSDKNRLLRIYDYKDGMKRYMETLLLPIGLTPLYGKTATRKSVWTNMVTHALNKFAADTPNL